MLCAKRVNNGFDVDYGTEEFMVPAVSHQYSLRDKSVNSYTLVLQENDDEDPYTFDGYADAYEVYEASVVYDAPSSQKKRRRKPLPTRPHIPRILKHDTRRDFGAMFTNVFNSADYVLMTSFINRYHRSDHEYRMLLQGQDDPIVVLNGHTQMASYWYERMNDASDILFRMEQSQLTVSSNGTSVFSSEFNITGTRVEVNGQNLHQILALQALQHELKQQQQQPQALSTVSTQQRRVIHPQEFTNCMILDSTSVIDDSSSIDEAFMGFPTPSTQTATSTKNCPFMYDQQQQDQAQAQSFFSLFARTGAAQEQQPQIQFKDYRVKGRVSIFLDTQSMCERIEFVIYPDMERYEEMKARLMLIRARHNPDRIR